MLLEKYILKRFRCILGLCILSEGISSYSERRRCDWSDRTLPVWLQTNHKWTGGRGLESSQLHKTWRLKFCLLREITIPRSYLMMLSSTAFCFPLYLNAMFAPCVPRCVFKADVNYHFADKLYNLTSSYPAIYIYPIVGFLSQLPQGKIWASAILWGLGSI